MLRVEHVKKSYGKKTILEDINMQVYPGEMVAIIGRNGCGKSTLLQILAGVQKPDAGELEYVSTYPLRDTKKFRELCGYVPQENPLLEEMTVADMLTLYGIDKKGLSDDMLKGFELEGILKQTVSKLSGGMKRRVSIACCVQNRPQIIFMDEPTTALDIFYKSSIHDWMEQYRKKQGILVITSHDEKEILFCDRCFLMTGGVLRELKEEEKNEHTIRQLIVENL